MTVINEILHNDLLVAACASWLVAQVLKTIIYSIMNKELDLGRLVGDGGLPSGHSATVTALAVMSALKNGFGSFEFAIAAVLAIIVMHDAMGVRRESGRHAQILNDLLHYLEEEPDIVLKEMLGHTPNQVVAGAIVGAIVASIMYFIVV